ncbi:MAG: 16S rRNA (cytidine(1402)-2'-O)-methyltransferase [Alphaproteobacteria bacterium]
MSGKNKEKDVEKPEALKFKPGLYCVATPIGNLRDITLRALDILQAVDVVLCEDTRVTSKLMRAYQIKATLRRYNDHSGQDVRKHVAEMIEAGQSVVLVSDAGMPLVSDPGYKLVRFCQQAGLYVTTLPGANAPLSALQLSGLPSDKFCFLGFLPPRVAARRKVLAQWEAVDASLIVFETAPRLAASLRDIGEVYSGREVAVVREITKMFEEVRRDVPQVLLEHYEAQGLPKGEVVLVIAPPGEESVFSLDDPKVFEMLREALETTKVKRAAKDVAEKTGLKASDLYDIALKISGR